MLFTGRAAPISAMSRLVLSQGNITIGSQDLTILVPTSPGPDNGFLCIDPSVINNWSRHAASRGVTSHSVTDDRTLMLDTTQRRVFTESMSMFMQVGTIYSLLSLFMATVTFLCCSLESGVCIVTRASGCEGA